MLPKIKWKIIAFLFVLSLSVIHSQFSIIHAQLDVRQAPEDPNLPWVYDKDVDFAGKTAARSKELLNWVIPNYHWSSIGGDNNVNPFDTIWTSVRNIVFGVLGLFILVAAFLLIITQGKSLTVRKFVLRFILVVILVFLSFAIVRFLYQIGDIIQEFFLKVDQGNNTRDFITDRDLLSVGFEYPDFVGHRIANSQLNESAFISTLLVKLTAITYYAMFIILIVRKVILWFFLVVSPIFPLLLLFHPLRNSAKIWAGEFFRWLLYAPLFAVFLSGLVSLWRLWDFNVPLNLHNLPCSRVVDSGNLPGEFLFPSATNILLGGPCQQIGWFNNLNTPDAFIEYVVALLMLWMVIIVPFILLRIFLSYFQNISINQGNIAKYIATASSPILNRYRFPQQPPPGVPPVSPTPQPPGTPPALSTGLAKSIPEFETKTAELQRKVAETASTSTASSMIEQLAAKNIEEAHRRNQISQTTLASTGIPAAMPATSEIASRVEEQVARGIEQNQTTNSSNISSVTSQTLQDIAHQASSIAEQAQSSNNINMIQIARNIERSAAENLRTQITTGQVVNTQAFKDIQVQAQNLSSIAQAANQPELSSAARRVEETVTKHIEVMEQINKQVNQDILNLTSLSIPTMQEIAKYEGALMSGDTGAKSEVLKVTEILSRIAGESTIATPTEKQYFDQIKDRLLVESKRGNTVAASILKASKAKEAALPEISSHPVNLESYEEVKKTWSENYRKLEPPADKLGKQQTRKAWLKEDIRKIAEAIDLLMSGDPEKQKQGREIVSKILPFLLLGGFSKQEIVAYLKAKLEAAKAILAEISVQEEKDETLLPETKKKEQPKTMEAHMEIPEEEKDQNKK